MGGWMASVVADGMACESAILLVLLLVFVTEWLSRGCVVQSSTRSNMAESDRERETPVAVGE
jgi:hypothetical protein